MSYRKTLARLLGVTAFGWAGLSVLSAADANRTISRDSIDKDKDGWISREEFMALQAEASVVFGLRPGPTKALEDEAAARASDFDLKKFLNRDGVLPEEKLETLLLAREKVTVYQLDYNLDGRLEDTDLPLQNEFIESRLKLRKERQNAPLQGKITSFKEIIEKSPWDEKNVKLVLEKMDILERDTPPNPLGQFRLREDANVNLDEIDSLEKAKPATLSFTHDYKDKGRESTDIKMAIIRPFPEQGLELGTAGTKRPKAYLIPSLSWQKINGTAEDDVDVRTLSIGGGITWSGGERLKNQVVLTGNHVDNAENSSRLVNAEITYTPYYNPSALGSFKQLIKALPFEQKLDLTLKASMSDVLDAGADENLTDRDDTLRVGGTVALTVRPQGAYWDRLNFTASFSYESALSGSPQKADLLDLGIKWFVDESRRFSTELNYQDGEVMIVETPIRRLVFKLGVTF